jgi:hypothetical protein
MSNRMALVHIVLCLVTFGIIAETTHWAWEYESEPPWWLRQAVADTAVPAPPDSGWSFSDRVTNMHGKPLPAERSQDVLAHVAMCCGFGDPGLHDQVLSIDAPAKAPLLAFAIATPDTLLPKPLAACAEVKPTPGVRTYLVVVRQGGAVPDSLCVVLADGSTFTVLRNVEQSP